MFFVSSRLASCRRLILMKALVQMDRVPISGVHSHWLLTATQMLPSGRKAQKTLASADFLEGGRVLRNRAANSRTLISTRQFLISFQVGIRTENTAINKIMLALDGTDFRRPQPMINCCNCTGPSPCLSGILLS